MASPNGMKLIGSNPSKDGLGAFRRFFEETRLIPDIALPSIQCKLSFQQLHDR